MRQDPMEGAKRDPQDNRTAFTPAKKETMPLRSRCAYNQTRECFLGLDISIADLPAAVLAEKIQSMTLKSGEGLWIAPYRGLPTSGVPAPLDLMYLDEQGRVIETVESFPMFQARSDSLAPASVLVLPSHSIYSSQTQQGDQMVVCMAEEMEVCLEELSYAKSDSVTVQSAAVLREQPLWSGGPGIVELESPASGAKPSKDQPHVMNLEKPEGNSHYAPKNWLERWWSPDPRKAPRERPHGLAAYYWDGAAPKAHGIRDISSTGLYVVTEERWYPGTLVLMTLQRTDCGEEVAERSIAVLSRAVRWGQDGVGLQFILHDPNEARKGNSPVMDTADVLDFETFLQQLRETK